MSGRQIKTIHVLDLTGPSDPTNLQATATDSSITLTWDASTDNILLDGYLIYQGAYVAGQSSIIRTNSATRTATITGLLPSTSYTFYIRAIDWRDITSSTPVIVTTSTTADVSPPTPPLLTAANITTSGMRISWPASTDVSGVAGYQLQRLIGGTWTNVGVRSG